MVVALMNDTVFPGGDGVRYSLALVNGLTAPLAALFLWKALKPYREARARYEVGG